MKTCPTNTRLFLVILFFIGPLMSNWVFAQNFQTIYPERSAHFSTKDINFSVYGNSTNQCAVFEECLLGIRIDSVDQLDPDIHYFPAYARTGMGVNGFCQGASWMGDKWIQLEEVEYFFNGEEDTIKIYPTADIGTTWRLFEMPNGYIEAKVIGISSGLVLWGLLDQIKTIELNRKDNQGNSVQHLLNNKQMLISENYGFVRTYDFFHFPNRISPKNLIGMTNPDLGQNLLPPRDLFNFEIGLERHYTYYFEEDIQHSYSDRETKLVVIDSTHVGDSIIYQIERSEYNKYGNQLLNMHDTIYTEEEISYTLPIRGGVLDIHPYEWYVNPDEPLYDKGTNFIAKREGRWLKFALDKMDLYLDDCYHFQFWVTGDRVFQKGLGKTVFENYSPFYSFNGSWEELVYFKTNDEEWGTPLTFGFATSAKAINEEQNNFDIFPNPFLDQLHLRSKSSQDLIGQYTILDLYGQMIQQGNAGLTSQISIELPEMSSGIYLLKWTDQEGRQWSTKLVKE